MVEFWCARPLPLDKWVFRHRGQRIDGRQIRVSCMQNFIDLLATDEMKRLFISRAVGVELLLLLLVVEVPPNTATQQELAA